MLRRRLVVIVLVLLLAGCMPGDLGLGRLGPKVSIPLPELTVDSDLEHDPDVAAALDAYRTDRPDIASALVNRALQGHPDNSRLHYLNGQIYLAWSGIGFPQYRDLAEVAFRMALRTDPSNVEAARALATFYSKADSYQSAVLALANVINQDPGQDRDLEALARAAYLAGQPTTAKWSADTVLARSGPSATNPSFLALAALANAGAGYPDPAHALLERYSAVAADPQQVARLERAIAEWPAVRAARQRTAAAGPAAPTGQPAPVPPSPGAQAPPTSFVPPPPPPSALAGGTPFVPDQAAPPPAAPPAGPPVSHRWDACDSPPNDIDPGDLANNNGNYNAGSYDVSQSLTIVDPNSSSTNTPLLPLPSPCADRPAPRMALIDVVVIRVNGLTSRRLGVNLLDQLQVVLGGSITSQRVFSSTAPTATTTTVIGSIGLPAAGITYSLNIANALDQRSEVVARPTLVALDRRASHYFSGQSLVAGLPGGSYGGSSFIEIPTGVDLYVVPTFVDDDDVLLSVRASRSSFEEQIASQLETGFDNQILTERNAVTASVTMKMGETLILSGLTERALDSQSSRVPGLGDIPGPNLAFNEQLTVEEENSVLIIMTPRRAGGSPPADAAPVGFLPEEATAFSRMLEARVRAAGLNPSGDAALPAALDPASHAVVFPLALLPPA